MAAKKCRPCSKCCRSHLERMHIYKVTVRSQKARFGVTVEISGAERVTFGSGFEQTGLLQFTKRFRLSKFG